MKVVRFAGVCLGGGKTDRTAVAVIEFYPEQKRIFLRSLREKIKAEGELSADLVLHSVLTEEEKNLKYIAFDVPLQMPKCMRCRLKCPGYERCKVPAIKWLWSMHDKYGKSKRPAKIFTPYTERCAEVFVANEIEEGFHPQHALGSNLAPLTARGLFLTRRLKKNLIEVYPELSLWRIGRALKINKSYLRFHKHSVDGDEARLAILKTLIEREIAFIYTQDMKTMVENNSAFEAFLCALTAFLEYRGQSQKRPASFPKGEAWITFPQEDIQWF